MLSDFSDDELRCAEAAVSGHDILAAGELQKLSEQASTTVNQIDAKHSVPQDILTAKRPAKQTPSSPNNAKAHKRKKKRKKSSDSK